MTKYVFAVLVAVSLATSVSAHDHGSFLSFDGGIGVIPVAGVAGAVNPDGTFPNVTRNIVRGVNPGAGPWRIGSLTVDIDGNGRIKARGKGLLLASGNSIGQNANQRVFATLICEPAATFVEHSSDLGGVPLAVNGDFRIDDTLSAMPAACASPVLLIRSSSINGNPWFAAAILKNGDDDN